jgi:serine phosphatase RsbU (regulator of sigma subunit)
MYKMNMKNKLQGNGTANERRLPFRGIYFIGLAATTIGIGVIILLNLATPLEYMRGRLPDPNREWYQKLHHVLNLAFLLLLSCPLLLLIIRRFLRPIAEYFNLLRACQETEDSGQFMTLFYLNLDPTIMQACWVRAGHDPAIFYDPVTDSFEELGGSGIALGVDDQWNYKEYTKTDLNTGQIIFLSTDGIWEAFNQKDEMFGKERIYNIIRKNSFLSADEIINIMIASLKSFQQGAQLEDDITMVVVRIN